MNDRPQKIIELRENDWTWQAIGNYFGISKARAHQIGSGYKSQLIIYDEIKIRDSYKCQWGEKCKGKWDGFLDKLIIHHIDFNDRNNNPKNLITLCKSCHSHFHLSRKYHSESPMIVKHLPTTKMIKKECMGCGTIMELYLSSKIKYCSKECKMKKWEKVCNYCGKTFIVGKWARYNYYRNHERFNRPSYCSKKCYFDYIAQKKLDN